MRRSMLSQRGPLRGGENAMQPRNMGDPISDTGPEKAPYAQRGGHKHGCCIPRSGADATGSHASTTYLTLDHTVYSKRHAMLFHVLQKFPSLCMRALFVLLAVVGRRGVALQKLSSMSAKQQFCA